MSVAEFDPRRYRPSPMRSRCAPARRAFAQRSAWASAPTSFSSPHCRCFRADPAIADRKSRRTSTCRASCRASRKISTKVSVEAIEASALMAQAASAPSTSTRRNSTGRKRSLAVARQRERLRPYRQLDRRAIRDGRALHARRHSSGDSIRQGNDVRFLPRHDPTRAPRRP